MRLQFRAGTERLTHAYPSLSRQLKKCAAYILEHPSEVATLSMRQVASRAEVPPTNMHRLARSLGFSTYNDFRDIFRNSVMEVSAGYPEKADQMQAVVGESDIEEALGAFHSAAVANVNGLFDGIDPVGIRRAIDVIAAARKVVVVGMHASFSFANYMHYVAAMGLRNWHLVSRLNGELSDQIEDLTSQDAVIAIALKPSAADTIRVARRARESGARVIAITDSPTSALAAYSSEILLTPVNSPSFFESYVAPAALIEMLVGMIVARSGRTIIENIDSLERCRQEMGEYWRDE